MGIFKDLMKTRKQMKALRKEAFGGTGSSIGMLKDLVSEAPAMIEGAGEMLRSTKAAQADAERLATEGVPGTATIVAVRDSGMTIGVGGMDNPVAELDLDTRVGDRPPVRVTTRQIIPRLSIGRLVPGTTLPVKLDPMDPSKLAILWDAPAPPPPTAERSTGP